MQGDGGRSEQVAAAATPENGPLVRVTFSLSRATWRVGPAWAVLAGAVAAGWSPADAGAILHLAAAMILGDLVWGSLRWAVPPGSGRPSSPDPHASFPSLPYAQPKAPLTRFLQVLGAGMGMPAGRSWQPVAFGVASALGLGWFLGPAALALTLVALLVTAWAWAWAVRRGQPPALVLALLDVGLPGLLGASLAWTSFPVGRPLLLAVALLVGFTVLQWGVYRAARQAGVWQAWAGQLAVLAGLVALQRPIACAIVAASFAPATWWLTRAPEQAAARGQVWWWAAFLAAFLLPG